MTNFVPVCVFTGNPEMDALIGRLAAVLPCQFEALSNRIAGSFPSKPPVTVTVFASISDSAGKALLRVEYTADSVAPFSSLSGKFARNYSLDSRANRFYAMAEVAIYIASICADKSVTIEAGYELGEEGAANTRFAAILNHSADRTEISEVTTSQ